MTKYIYSAIFIVILLSVGWRSYRERTVKFYTASNQMFQYTGRIDFANPELPRFWSPGVYIKAKFKGNSCIVHINDEVLYGKSHNYVSIVIDDQPVRKIKLSSRSNTINVGENLSDKDHTLLLCKSTESSIGYMEFAGLTCEKLLTPPKKPLRRIEFIGNSITCGTGSDVSGFPCGTGEWYDQHNAYMSYGARTARLLNAQWQLTAVSGIGLVRSCCNMKLVMPQVFDKTNLTNNTIAWNFKSYQPDVVTVCLGQNDGIIDSVKFCTAYLEFIKTLRTAYPAASIVCLTSPMADASLIKVQKNYLSGITSAARQQGDRNIYKYFFSRRFNSGCGDHPNLEEHGTIAQELTAFIKQTKRW